MTMHNPLHPGVLIDHDHMRPLNLSSRALAKRLGVTGTTISRLIAGKTSISPTMAVRLATLFNTTPELWLNLQRNYDLHQLARPMNRKLFAGIVPLANGETLPA